MPDVAPAGRKKLVVLVIIAVLVVAGLGVAVVLLLAAPQAATLGIVEFRGARTAIDQREVLLVSAVALDTTGANQTANATFSWSVSPAGAFQVESTGVGYSVRITALRAGAVTLNATAAWGGTTRTGSLAFTVRALQYVLTPQDPFPLVNTATDLEVRVVYSDTSVAQGYRGTVNLSASNYGAVALPANSTFTAFDLGVKVLSVTVVAPGLVQITARDTLAASITRTVGLTGNRPPTAAFTRQADPVDPLRVLTDASTSSDLDGDALTYDWAFGDGTTAAGVTASHAYAAGGLYTIALVVRDTRGASAIASQSFQARALPTASFAIDDMVPVGADIQVTVNASGSSDPDGTISSYEWTWGDATPSTNTSAAVVQHTYAGSFDGQVVTILLRVTDNDNLADVASRAVTVSRLPIPPTAAFTYTLDQLNRTVLVDGSGSNDPNGNLVYYNWTWGDGTWTNGTSPTASHRYAADGPYLVTLVVVDSTNLQGAKVESITIAQPAVDPTASFTATRTRFHVDLDASSSFDANGDITAYEWDFTNDGTFDAIGLTTAHDYPTPGLRTIRLRVTDSRGQQDNATRKVSPAASTIDYDFWDYATTRWNRALAVLKGPDLENWLGDA